MDTESAKHFELIKKICMDMQSLRIEVVELQDEPLKDRVGQNTTILLQRLLNRSLALIESGIGAIERRELLASSLLARAHIETAGVLSYVLKHFKKYHAREITTEEINGVLHQAWLGSTENLIENSPQPVNVMKAIDSLDQMVKEVFPTKLFREQYVVLCQYCHPNFSGTSCHTEVDFEAKEVRTLTDADSFEHNGSIAIGMLELSGGFFIRHWTELYAMVSEKEKMPSVRPKSV